MRFMSKMSKRKVVGRELEVKNTLFNFALKQKIDQTGSTTATSSTACTESDSATNDENKK